jgi:hypothetical protein
MDAKEIVFAGFRVLDALLALGIAVLIIRKNRGSWRRTSAHPLHRGPRQWRFGMVLLFFGLAFGSAWAAVVNLPGTPAAVYTAGFLWVIFDGLRLDYKERLEHEALHPWMCPYCGQRLPEAGV